MSNKFYFKLGGILFLILSFGFLIKKYKTTIAPAIPITPTVAVQPPTPTPDPRLTQRLDEVEVQILKAKVEILNLQKKITDLNDFLEKHYNDNQSLSFQLNLIESNTDAVNRVREEIKDVQKRIDTLEGERTQILISMNK